MTDTFQNHINWEHEEYDINENVIKNLILLIDNPEAAKYHFISDEEVDTFVESTISKLQPLTRDKLNAELNIYNEENINLKHVFEDLRKIFRNVSCLSPNLQSHEYGPTYIYFESVDITIETRNIDRFVLWYNKYQQNDALRDKINILMETTYPERPRQINSDAVTIPKETTNKFIYKEKLFWEIGFNGQMLVFQDRVGLKYIHTLLSMPNHLLDYLQLTGSKESFQDNPTLDMSEFKDGNENQRGEITNKLGGTVESGDDKTRDEIEKSIDTLQKEIKKINTKLNNAENDINRNDEAVDDWIKKLIKYEEDLQYLMKNKSKYAKINKITTNERKNPGNAVRKAIKESIMMISTFNKDLGDHLKKSIDRNNGKIAYSPAEEVIWITTE